MRNWNLNPVQEVEAAQKRFIIPNEELKLATVSKIGAAIKGIYNT